MNFRKQKKFLKPTPSTLAGIQAEINFVMKFWKQKYSPIEATIELNKYLQTKIIQLERIFVEEQNKSMRLNMRGEARKKEIAEQKEKNISFKEQMRKTKNLVEEKALRYKEKLTMIKEDEKYLKQLGNKQSQMKDSLQSVQKKHILTESAKEFKLLELKALGEEILKKEEEKEKLVSERMKVIVRREVKREKEKKERLYEEEKREENRKLKEIKELEQRLEQRQKEMKKVKIEIGRIEEECESEKQKNNEKRYRLEVVIDQMQTIQKKNLHFSRLSTENSDQQNNYLRQKDKVLLSFKQNLPHFKLTLQHSKKLIFQHPFLIK